MNWFVELQRNEYLIIVWLIIMTLMLVPATVFILAAMLKHHASTVVEYGDVFMPLALLTFGKWINQFCFCVCFCVCSTDRNKNKKIVFTDTKAWFDKYFFRFAIGVQCASDLFVLSVAASEILATAIYHTNADVQRRCGWRATANGRQCSAEVCATFGADVGRTGFG